MAHTQNTEFVKCTDELDGYFLFCETNFYNNIIEKDPNMQDVFQRNILDTYIYFDITFFDEFIFKYNLITRFNVRIKLNAFIFTFFILIVILLNAFVPF